jgi:hypothetical protein
MLDDGLLSCAPELVSATDCEDPSPRSVMVSMPLLDPVFVGLNLTEIVQLLAAAMPGRARCSLNLRSKRQTSRKERRSDQCLLRYLNR